MRNLLLLSALFVVASAGFFEDVYESVKDFGKYVADKAVEYYDESEKFVREEIFGENLQKVKEHNKLFEEGKSSYELGVNDFTDMRFAEVKDKYTGLQKVSERLDKSLEYNFPERNGELTSKFKFDWRNHGGVTPVKKQGDCLSCWAFGVAATIEGHIKKRTGKLIRLSPQHLIDCSSEFHNEGCAGGFQEYAFAYIAKNQGIALEDDYPYTGKENKCQYNPSKTAISIKGFTRIPVNDENKMKQIISNVGPLACSVGITDEFALYKGGVFADPACNSSLEPSHTVTVIGYGDDHWLVKNSWGHTWGENGYMRLAFNNWCNIALECSYPVF